MAKIEYLTKERLERILKVFKDQKEKHEIEELPTSKIQGLTGINAYVFAEVLSEMKKQGKIIKSKKIGNRVYWKLT